MTAKRGNGAGGASEAISTFATMLQSPAANSVVMSQRFALEAARFWARRLHAYADQMEKLATCTTPGDVAQMQTRFLDRMREDYAEEGAALTQLITPKSANGEDRPEA